MVTFVVSILIFSTAITVGVVYWIAKQDRDAD